MNIYMYRVAGGPLTLHYGVGQSLIHESEVDHMVSTYIYNTGAVYVI